jgi:hypothetical protein
VLDSGSAAFLLGRHFLMEERFCLEFGSEGDRVGGNAGRLLGRGCDE